MVSLLTFAQEIPQSCRDYMGSGWGWGHMYGGGWPMGGAGGTIGVIIFSILWFVFTILVIAVLIALVRWLWKKGEFEEKKK